MFKTLAQALTFVLRMGSMAVLARVLDPKDFGIVAMVTAITGVLTLIKDGGLSLPTIQRETISDAQLSTLFWLNVLVGVILTLFCIGLAPILARFYHEPNLVWVTIATAPAFLLSALGVQHSAILVRHMRFPVCAAIDVGAILISSVVGIVMALAGAGLWSLVIMSLAQPAAASVGAWIAARWVPGPPRRGTDIRSMIKLGGALTLNSLIIYVAYNLDKVLLGRYWGASVIGSYGRAYTLVNIPTENLNAAVGSVALSALSRLQGDPVRLKAYFLKGYSLILALTIPATVACAVFSEEIVAVILGPKWSETAALVRLLSPTILVFALINPTFWLAFSAGMMGRSLRMAVVILVLVSTAYFLGLPYGARGVASAFSIAMALWLVPHIVWCLHGTAIRVRDIVSAASKPIISGAAGLAACVVFEMATRETLPPLVRLVLGGCLLGAVYAGTLLYVLRQKAFYVDLAKQMMSSRAPATVSEPPGVPDAPQQVL